MSKYPPSKYPKQPTRLRRGPDGCWTPSLPEPEPPDDQRAGPAPLVVRPRKHEAPVTVGGLVVRGSSPHPRSRGLPVNPQPGASPVRPATGNGKDVEENPRSPSGLGATARPSSPRPAPAPRRPTLVTVESTTGEDVSPHRRAFSPGHRKMNASTRRPSPEFEQRDSFAAWNPAVRSMARNVGRGNPQSEPAPSAVPPVSTARRSRHRESVRREMREHAEQAEARANAAYEQNRAALELISKSMDNVRNAYAEAGRVRDRFHDLLSVSSRTRHKVRRHQELRTSSDR